MKKLTQRASKTLNTFNSNNNANNNEPKKGKVGAVDRDPYSFSLAGQALDIDKMSSSDVLENFRKAMNTTIPPPANKNLAKISAAFRKSLDPISKRDVRDLINIPDDDYIAKLQLEHDEKARAPPSSAIDMVSLEELSTSVSNKFPDLQKSSSFQTGKLKLKSFTDALQAVADNEEENEFLSSFRNSLVYKTASGSSSLNNPSMGRTRGKPSGGGKPPTSSLLRSDPAKKALLKYKESQDQLEGLVKAKAFKDMVDPLALPKNPFHSTEVKAVLGAASSASPVIGTRPPAPSTYKKKKTLQKVVKSGTATPAKGSSLSKLDTANFDKYVEEMKKVTEKASKSFADFNEKQAKIAKGSFSLSKEDQEKVTSAAIENFRRALNPAASATLQGTTKNSKAKLPPSVPSLPSPPPIPAAFKRNVDAITKMDVRKLINIPDYQSPAVQKKKLDLEHKERSRAHLSVFKNVVVAPSRDPSPPSSIVSASTTASKAGKDQNNNDNPPAQRKMSSSNIKRGYLLDEAKQKPRNFTEAIQAVAQKSDENDVYSTIKNHLEYEMNNGPPNLSTGLRARKPSYTKVPQKASILRSDAAGKALIKHRESQDKLQGLVNTFKEKVQSSVVPLQAGGDGPLSSVSESDEGEEAILENASELKASDSSLDSRKKTSLEVNATLSKSMKTIGRASSVVQRLGTLMSRVSLRNEKYKHEMAEASAAAAASANNKESSTSTTEKEDERMKRVSVASFATTSKSYMTGEQGYGGPKKSTSSIAIQANASVETNSVKTERIRALEAINKPSIPTKLPSSQFDKYVEEMKKVAQKAAESFEKFKERQAEDEAALSFSEEEEAEDDEITIATIENLQRATSRAIQQRPTPRLESKSGVKQRERLIPTGGLNKPSQRSSGSGMVDRLVLENQSSKLASSTAFKEDSKNKEVDGATGEFKFLPDMNYTDQLMLQKLRKLKEKEGWGDSVQSQLIQLAQAADFLEEHDNIKSGVNDDGLPSQDEMQPMLKRTLVSGEIEKQGMGAALSLNNILRK